MGQIVSNILFVAVAFILTVLSGYPISRYIGSRAQISKVVLAFAFGFGAIAISGIIGNIIDVDFFVLQSALAGLLISQSEINIEGFMSSKSYTILYNKGAMIFEFDDK